MTGRRRCRCAAAQVLQLAAALGLMLPALASPAMPPSEAAIAATVKRDSLRCREQAILDACYDAVRRNPADAALSVYLGDALVRAKRPADALRAYRRAAQAAPNTPGLAAKINSVVLGKSVKRVARIPPVERSTVERGSGKRFSNAAPEGQSH